MNRLCKKVLIILLILFSVLQVLFYNKFNEYKGKREHNNVVEKEVIKYKNLDKLSKELDCLNEKNILSANKLDDIWRVEVKISGNKQSILEEVSKLRDYDINNYIINKNEEENCIILEISGKECE